MLLFDVSLFHNRTKEEEKSISYWEESEQNLKASKKKEREMVRAGYLAP